MGAPVCRRRETSAIKQDNALHARSAPHIWIDMQRMFGKRKPLRREVCKERSGGGTGQCAAQNGARAVLRLIHGKN